MVKWFKDRESFEYFRSNKQMKKLKLAERLVCASLSGLLILMFLIGTVHGQRCPVYWTDFGLDGCVFFHTMFQVNSEQEWHNAICTKYADWAGNTPQLARFRDSSQQAADESYEAFRAQLNYLNTQNQRYEDTWFNIIWNPLYPFRSWLGTNQYRDSQYWQ